MNDIFIYPNLIVDFLFQYIEALSTTFQQFLKIRMYGKHDCCQFCCINIVFYELLTYIIIDNQMIKYNINTM